MRASPALAAALALAAAACGRQAHAQTVDYALRSSGAFEVDDNRDLGLAGGGNQGTLFLNLAPRALLEMGPSWTGYLRGRVFLPTRKLTPFDSSTPENSAPSTGFVGMNEFWIQYNGFTTYPGEALRLGRQHIRQTDSEWWDQDVDALRWLLDSTLLSTQVGVAHQFSTYRSDAVSVPTAQRNRTYFFGDVATEIRPEQRLGLRVVHANGAVDLTWMGAYADNGFYDIRGPDDRLAYGLAVNYLAGRDSLATVHAWQTGGGLRLRPSSRGPLQFGAAYSYSSRDYQQSGMQGNTSYFTGTDTLVGRYNEVLRPQLGNLAAGTVFVSMTFVNNDASLIFTTLRRDNGAVAIDASGLTVAPTTASRDLGNGLDLVVTHFLTAGQRPRRLLDRGDAFTAPHRRSLVSLRASLFAPGAAYGPSARDAFRLLLEVTLWYD